ncbi:MAG: hypothetical protein WBH97_09345, partial [Rectinemataceae bacterium]
HSCLSNATLLHSLFTAQISKNDDKERVMVEASVRLESCYPDLTFSFFLLFSIFFFLLLCFVAIEKRRLSLLYVKTASFSSQSA